MNIFVRITHFILRDPITYAISQIVIMSVVALVLIGWKVGRKGK